MKCPECKTKNNKRGGFSLLEITLVLGLLLALSTFTVFGAGYFSKLNAARRTEGVLRQVENARMSYLVDNPNLSYSDLSVSVLANYMPDPSILAELPNYGYSLTDADVKAFPMTYGRNTDALPVASQSFIPR